jgi:serine/threonine protein kinase/Tol biopolymer transport system component
VVMNPERWQIVEGIFQKVLDADVERRSSVLEDSCASDESLRREVESLLAQYENAGNFMEKPAFTTFSDTFVLPTPRPGGLSPTKIPAGTEIGRYRIGDRIGSGGMGVIYEAEDLKLRRHVALKFLPEEVTGGLRALQRFRLEARTASALNHPNICTIYEVDEIDGLVFIAMELLQGQTLKPLISGRPLQAETALSFGVQIAGAIGAAHSKGIVHRDIKPANIFITKQRRVKVLDFGVAKLMQPDADSRDIGPRERTEAGMIVGTVGYMSPEQVRGEAVDPRSDIFAFGAVLYEMLTGRRAFDKPTAAETMAAILNEDPPAILELGVGIALPLVRVMKRCLQKEPDDRFQSASDLAFALEALSGSGDTPALTIPASAISKRRWRWLGLAAAAAAFGLLFSLLLKLSWRLSDPVAIVESITQLTDDGEPKPGKRGIFTGGSRIYFNEGSVGSWKIAMVSVSGGLTSIIDTKVAELSILNVTPNGSDLLAADYARNTVATHLWSIPLAAGEAYRLGSIEASGADYLPDGRIIYTSGKDVFVADANGLNQHKLLSLAGRASFPRVSPDGKEVVAQILRGGNFSLVEFGTDGTAAHTLDPGYRICCGAMWTADGKYLVYQASNKISSDIWALPVGEDFSQRSRQPIKLTTGPLLYQFPAPSRDGKQIFVIGSNRRGELTRFDMQSRRFLPFLSGISAREPTFSRDGEWVAYVSYPDGMLWRSRIDGSDKLQLTYPPMEVRLPRISPDGKSVSFSAWVEETSSEETFVMDMDRAFPPKKISSGESEWVDAATWSPDGNLLLESLESRIPGDRDEAELRIADLRTGKMTAIPGSQGMLGGKWISQDSILAAKWDGAKFQILDLKTQKWTDLLDDLALTAWEVSPDRKYVYYTTGGVEPKAWRLQFADRKVEEITSLKEADRARSIGWINGIDPAPDGSPIFTRDIGTQEIYALNVRWAK